MAIQPNKNEPNEHVRVYTKLKAKIRCLKMDIFFLKQCKKEQVFPNFIKTKCSVTNSRTDTVIKSSMKLWLKLELKYLYGKLSRIEEDAFKTHWHLVKVLNEYELDSLLRATIDESDEIDCSFAHKREKLNKKFEKLKNEKFIKERIERERTKSGITIEPVNSVKNLSNQSFTNEEMSVLQKGLKFSPKPRTPPIIDLVADIETGVKYCKETVKQEIRDTVISAIKKSSTQKVHSTSKTAKFEKVLKSLKEKDCLYMKSDKGRDIVIMDKSHYKEKVIETINMCNFQLLNKNPLPSMTRATNSVLKEVESIYGAQTKWKLMTSNPSVPKLYCLPKTHKDTTNLKMRPIVSNCNAPTENISKWLVNEFNRYPKPTGLYVENCHEFCDKMKNVRVGENESIVSFDVESLFPSIPIPDTLIILENWLLEHEPSKPKRDLLQKLTKLCMDQNISQFDEKFYIITKGTCMGNALSPFLANLFMSHFEMKMKEEGILPKIWWRYVDDVAAIVEKGTEQHVLTQLNSKWPTIKFTIETEENGSLPFLDVCLNRKSDGSIDFSVYRKPSNTPCYIPADSHCPMSHKRAAFHSMTNRLCKLPLNIKNYMDELKNIKYAALVNGYSEQMVDKLVATHSNRMRRRNITSLTPERDQPKRISMPYIPEITNKLKSVFKRHGFDIVYSSNNKLQNSIVRLKDKTNELKKSGIYEIACGECDEVYTGQTKRSVEVRFKEHLTGVQKREATKSAVALHSLEYDHTHWSIENVKLKKQVNNAYKLDAYESIYMYLNRSIAMNTMPAPIRSPLFRYIERYGTHTA